MSDLRPYPIRDTKGNTWTNRIVDTVNSNQVHGGDGVSVVGTPNGFQLSVTPQIHKDSLVHKDEFNTSASYIPNDVVRVYGDKTYTDKNGNELKDIADGSWVCVRVVPDGELTSSFFLTTIVPQLQTAGMTPTDLMANNYRWDGLNKYYPIDPEPTGSATVSVSGYSIETNKTYWKKLGGGGKTIEVDICVNGVSHTAYVQGRWSGSYTGT